MKKSKGKCVTAKVKGIDIWKSRRQFALVKVGICASFPYPFPTIFVHLPFTVFFALLDFYLHCCPGLTFHPGPLPNFASCFPSYFRSTVTFSHVSFSLSLSSVLHFAFSHPFILWTFPCLVSRSDFLKRSQFCLPFIASIITIWAKCPLGWC